MASKEYHQAYWERYKKRTKRVSLTLTAEEYAVWEKRAKAAGNRTVGQQIKAEAEAYAQGEQVPSEAMEHWLAELSRLWRGIGTNLNQIAHHSNLYEELLRQSEAIELLKQVEQKARAFVTKARDQ